jgi:hypothetical protein
MCSRVLSGNSLADAHCRTPHSDSQHDAGNTHHTEPDAAEAAASVATVAAVSQLESCPRPSASRNAMNEPDNAPMTRPNVVQSADSPAKPHRRPIVAGQRRPRQAAKQKASTILSRPPFTGELHRLQARFSPVNFTEFPRVLVPVNSRPFRRGIDPIG